MTNEEFERAAKFIANQQAMFAESQQKFAETEQKFAENQQRLSSDVRDLADSRLRTERTLWTTRDVLGRIAGTQLQIAEAKKRTDESLAETNERLNSLIVVVERYFSNGRGNQ
jgi:chromosome segregation ATPase